MTARYAVSVDIGGTFTDFVLLDSRRNSVTTAKVPSTPARPDDAIFSGFEHLRRTSGFDLTKCDVFLHATTLITNAVIERRGHDFILLHTHGFGTTLETGREHRYNISNLRLPFPKPLTRHRLKIPVRERVSFTGEILQGPDRASVIADARRLVAETGVTNFAVCFLHAYRNPANEQLVAGWLSEVFSGAVVSTSSAVAPLSGEYERWMTCAVNAYTKPLLATYADRLVSKATDAGFAGRLMMMTSSGLPLPIGQCVGAPVRLIESGPAAGVLAAREIAGRNASGETSLQSQTVLAYDMGGTTAKAAFLLGGRIDVQAGLEVAREGAFEAGSGFPLMIPAVDLIEIGAGGGSIAEVDARGAIAVGPRSAGADPGPACYARGGTEATVTDANLLLGFLGEANFRNSGIAATMAEADRVIQDTVAGPLGITVERAAIGIHRTVNENVARACRVHAAELGIDYRTATLVCTGGSSPVHALPIARLLSIHRVIFPFAAGVASAMGLFTGHEGVVLQQSRTVALASIDGDLVSREVDALVAGDAYASQLLAQGARTAVRLGMRYEGQDSEVSVDALGSDRRFLDRAGIRTRFLDAYKDVFRVSFPDYPVEISTWIAEISWPDSVKTVGPLAYGSLTDGGDMVKAPRPCHLGDDAAGGRTLVPVFNRYALPVGWTTTGPALIEENDTTIFIPAFAHCRVAATMDIIAETGA